MCCVCVHSVANASVKGRAIEAERAADKKQRMANTAANEAVSKAAAESEAKVRNHLFVVHDIV